jgi:hypothetical protein
MCLSSSTSIRELRVRGKKRGCRRAAPTLRRRLLRVAVKPRASVFLLFFCGRGFEEATGSGRIAGCAWTKSASSASVRELPKPGGEVGETERAGVTECAGERERAGVAGLACAAKRSKPGGLVGEADGCMGRSRVAGEQTLSAAALSSCRYNFGVLLDPAEEGSTETGDVGDAGGVRSSRERR